MHTSDGKTYKYGSTYFGRHHYDFDKKTLAWHLDYVQDAMGNYIEYTYHNKDNVIYPYSIVYGKNTGVATKLENIINFEYITRTDKTPIVFDNSIRGEMGYILSGITSKSNGTIYRKYELIYDNTIDNSPAKYSRLTKVTEKNAANEALKPLKLIWNGLPSSGTIANNTLSFSAAPSGITHDDQNFISGDFNGDGRADIIGIYNQGIEQYACIYYNSGQFNKGNEKINLGQNVVYNKNGNGAYNRGVVAIDVNHDGVDDLVIPHFDDGDKHLSFSVLLSPLSTAKKHIISISGNPKNTFSEMPLFSVNDLDNDGCIDIIYLEKGVTNGVCNARIITISKDGEKSKDIPFKLNIPEKPEKLFVSDFNNDGLQDILVFYKGGYAIFWNQGNGLTESTFSNNQKTSGTNIENVWMIQAGDFNGDGMMDFIMNSTNDRNWYFALNKGNGEFEKKLACTIDAYDQDFTLKDDDKFSCLVYDLDFDGKSDVLITKAMYKKKSDIGGSWGEFDKTYTYWMRSDGTKLIPITSSTYTRESDSYSRKYIVADFNGDGQPELIHNGYNSCYDYPSVTGSYPAWRIYKNTSFSPNSGKVSSFIDGYDSETNITYESFTSSSIYQKGNDTPLYPIKNLILPVHGVSLVATSDGRGGFITTRYRYQGLKVHLTGKGLLGMSSTSVSNMTHGLTVESGVNKWDDKFYIPSQTYTKETGDGKTNTVETSFAVVKGMTKEIPEVRYTAYPSKKIETDAYNNKTTTTYTYNYDVRNIQPYLKKEEIDFGNNMYKTTIYSDSVSIGSKIKEYKPTVMTVNQKHADDSSIFTQKTKIGYDATTGYQTKLVENAESAQAITTDYTYDEVGNVKTTKMSGGDITTMTSYFVYDTSKRFVEKTYTSPSTITKSFTHNLWGNILTEKDETYSSTDPLVTSHSYDGWQNEMLITYPDGRETTIERAWNNYFYRHYYTLTQTTGEPWVKTYYDRLGRVTMVQSVGANGVQIEEETTFRGQENSKTISTKTGNVTTTQDYTYDARGREKTFSCNAAGNITYSYGNREVSTTIDGKKHTKIYDAWGNLKEAKDPVSSVQYLYHSSGNPYKVITNGDNSNAILLTYDNMGQRKTLKDPNIGLISYDEYNTLGKLKKQTQKQANNQERITRHTYDALNRIESTTIGGVVTNYTYGIDKEKYELDRLIKVQTGNNSISYTYDKYGRILKETRQIDSHGAIDFTYKYNTFGQVESISYPNSLTVYQHYDNYGNMTKVLAGTQVIWELKEETGKTTTTLLGGTLTATETRNAQGLLTNIKTTKGSTVLHNMDFMFNKETGNLTSRTGMIDQPELFVYDDVDRLIEVRRGNSAKTVMTIDYQSNGNIESKTGLGLYGYQAKPHAVTSIENTKGLIPENLQTITYTAFDKIATITEKAGNDNFSLNVTYGPDLQRWKTELRKNSSLAKTTIFAGDYEVITESSSTKHLYYIGGDKGLAAIYVKQAGQTDKIYYPHTDHLGSIMKLTDGNGTEVFKASYDAWGNQKISNNTFAFHRGYTGHEHLKEFGLINMNGRMYDPIVGRFLSPDPYVQMPDFSQNFNRYSYCLNNPLKFTDPSGEFFWIPFAIGATLGMYTGGVIANGGNYNPFKWDYSSGKTWGYMLGGAAIGGFSGVAGAEFAAMGHPFANTSAIAVSSFSYSSGMNAITGGEVGVSASFGVGSFTFGEGFGYLGKKGNKWHQDLAYSFGALANMPDLVSIATGGGENIYSIVEKKDKISHYALVNESESINISVGPYRDLGEGINMQALKSGSGTFKELRRNMRGKIWENHLNDDKGWKFNINNVSKKILSNKSNNLQTKMNNETLMWNLLGKSCVGYGAKALWSVGIPNLGGIHPYLLQVEMVTRQVGIYSSPYLYTLP